MAQKAGVAKNAAEQLMSGVIYARYSDHAQKDESIEQQIEECMEFARLNKIEIIHTYEDHAISGRSDKRAAFQRMIRDAGKCKFQVVIAYKSNRIARNMLNALTYENKLEQFGVRILYAKEEFGNTAAGRFALRTMMNVNQFYSENMSEDIRRGLMDNASKCMINSGRPPFGYKKGSDGRYALDEKCAPVAREIFERVAAGDLFVDIANDLNGGGITTGYGNRWNKNSFHVMLTNETYVGVYKYAEVRIEGGAPPIIGKELFDKVQRRLTSKKNPQGRHRESGDYLLTGKLFCGYCKSYMVGISGTGKLGTKHFYYSCNKQRVEKTCNKKAVRRDYIEWLVAEYTQSYVMQDDVVNWIADQYMKAQSRLRNDSELKIQEKKLKEVKQGIQNLLTAIEQGVITSSTKNRLLELERMQKQIEENIAASNRGLPNYTRDKVLCWIESFKVGDAHAKDYQARIINAFVDKVYLFDDEIWITYSYSATKNKVRHKLPDASQSNISDFDPTNFECSCKVSLGSPKKKHPLWVFFYLYPASTLFHRVKQPRARLPIKIPDVMPRAALGALCITGEVDIIHAT